MTKQANDAWEAALAIIEKLRARGHAAFLAGGCVRDRLLGLTPKDYDVATDATPTTVRRIYRRSRLVGAKFGVVLVRARGHDIEVATFRTDGTYADGRHPDTVTFGTAEEDARRRDFTINGLFYDPIDDRLIDYVDGQKDIEAGIIRTIGDPAQRFDEDHLRLLRAVRFAARFGFAIDPATMAAVRQHAARLSAISPERIWMELQAILTSPGRAEAWQLLCQAGLRPCLTPEWPVVDAYDALVPARLAALPPTSIATPLALAATTADLPAPQLVQLCQALRLSNQVSRTVCWLVDSLSAVRDNATMELADLKTLMAHDAWDDLLMLLEVDLNARKWDKSAYETVRQRAEQIPADAVAPPPLLAGDDLIAMGVTPGPEMGEILSSLYRRQLNEEIGTREEALATAESLRRSR